ncbi:hypothetical protein [Mesorhizobium sp. B2-8-9]|uniref:hypothetical protein n=1 Tax=Mesorhizobium sp. B2-8-9 TaxID=2589899 RepID=UPI00112EC33E|nr:hypothetical protein [Mesorhizobium sp. B2-8-9]TPI86407.1 hypothetical protein FJ423_00870 [Mesorhizobium sp. B2-8-9]
MGAYILACNLPNFQQSAPRGDAWKLAPNDDPRHVSALTWNNAETGESIVCPSIWYNAPAASYARSLRYGAERNDECAAYKATENKPWSAREAEANRHQARRLRAMALLCDRTPDAPAGSIDFRGLSDPTTPHDIETATIAAIEAEALSHA